MTVKDLADKLEAKVKDVMRVILEQGMRMTINSTLDADTATMLARQFGAEVEVRSFEEEIVEFEEGVSRPEDRETRAPVVTVMGHVDHGKTTLLDSLRTTRVAEREAGGITQHIGAYAVELNDRKIVFLDTPGHAAFTTMRARGAKVTDVVVLVVAADDGVMPQTREAIDHAKAAKVPIIVAINKIDKPDSNPERVMRELSEIGLLAEAWGGDTVMVPVSAKAKQNLDQLLEMILLVTEIGDLKANAARNASGTVLEGKLDRGRGPVATVLVQDGTLHVGDTVLVGTIVGKVRALQDDRGRSVREVGPSTPVEVLGLGGVPTPGDTFQAVEDVAKARQIAMFREEQAKAKSLGARGGRMTLETLQKHIAEGGVKELALIIKADVQGSAEVLADSLQKLGDERVKVRVISSGVGAINESDVLLATASEAIIIGFNVRPDRNAEAVANREKVDIRLHSIIYNVTDEMKAAMAGMLEPTFKDAAHRHGGGPRGVQDAQGRHRGRLPGHRGRHPPLGRCAGPPAPRRRRGAHRQAQFAAPLQGRRLRGQERPRVRHDLRALQRRQGRRHHRGVRLRRGRGHHSGLAADRLPRAGRLPRMPRCWKCEGAPLPRRPFSLWGDLDRVGSRRATPRHSRHSGIPASRHFVEWKMQGSGSRADRIADHIKDHVSQLLSFEVKDPAVGLLTVTHVKLTGDMGLAHVYYTLVGDEVERAKTARALDRATAFVRRRLAEDMNMRRAPDVRFHYDENVERQERVATLLQEIATERAEREKREQAETAPDDNTQ